MRNQEATGQSECLFVINAKRHLIQKTQVRSIVLQNVGKRPMASSERQMVTSIKDVEISHKARYFFASSLIKKQDRVLDACCGVGYGIKLMRDLSHANSIDGFDRSKEAIEIAKLHFTSSAICVPFEELNLEKDYYDVITCFEAIEHVENPDLLVKKLCNSLKPKGYIILSTPNERLMPWSKENHQDHLRHFTLEQIVKLLSDNGIKNIIPYFQNKWSPCITMGDRGKFLIFVGSKL